MHFEKLTFCVGFYNNLTSDGESIKNLDDKSHRFERHLIDKTFNINFDTDADSQLQLFLKHSLNWQWHKFIKILVEKIETSQKVANTNAAVISMDGVSMLYCIFLKPLLVFGGCTVSPDGNSIIRRSSFVYSKVRVQILDILMKVNRLLMFCKRTEQWSVRGLDHDGLAQDEPE